MKDYGIQMYSVRDITKDNMEGALKALAEMGYKYVEFAGFFGIPAEKIICCDTAAQAAETLKADGDEEIFVVTCFSDRDKLLTLTERAQ